MGLCKYDNTIKRGVLDCYKQGFSTRDCANKFGIPRSTIRLWIIRAGISRTISEAAKRMEKSPNWKGGISFGNNGYRVTTTSSMGGKRHREYEHRLIVEKALGRKLKHKEIVHHINGVNSDNRNCNLLVCSNEYHKWLHERMSAFYMKEHFQNTI